RFAVKDTRQCMNREHVPIPPERDVLSSARPRRVHAAIPGPRSPPPRSWVGFGGTNPISAKDATRGPRSPPLRGWVDLSAEAQRAKAEFGRTNPISAGHAFSALPLPRPLAAQSG